MSRRTSAIIKSPAVILGLLRAFDACVVLVSGVAAYLLWLWEEGHWPTDPYLLAILIGILLALQAFHLSGLYTFRLLDQVVKQSAKIVLALVVVAAILIALAFFTKESESFSRGWAGLWFPLAAIGIIAGRIVLFFLLRRWRRAGILTRHTIIVGAGDHARRLIEHNRKTRDTGIEIVGIFDDRRSRVPSAIDDIRVLGTLEDLFHYTRRHPVDLIIVALPWSAEQRLSDMMNLLRTVPVDVQLAPDSIGFRLFDRGVTHLGGIPMLTIFERPLSGWNRLLKGVEDRLLALLVLIVLSPLMLAVALAIKLSGPGPILFRQKRYGFNNEVFNLYKFRTMHNRQQNDAMVPQAQRNDPRVTRIGAILRRTSLDELPQLFNVLRGEMSMVGPRPHAVIHNEEYAKVIGQYYARHRVKPGITGWAQVNGFRGETDTAEKMAMRVQYDLYYIDNWSLLLDLRILVMTLFFGFVNRNAY